MLSLLTLLIVKHTIMDGNLQTSFQYLNKHRYFSAGGMVHGGLHGLGTAVAILLWSMGDEYLMAGILGLADALVHLHIDWLKVNVTKKRGWSRMEEGKLVITDNRFFIALMWDQCAHMLTYVAILGVMGL